MERVSNAIRFRRGANPPMQHPGADEWWEAMFRAINTAVFAFWHMGHLEWLFGLKVRRDGRDDPHLQRGR